MAVKLGVADCVAGCVWLGVPQPTERQHIGNYIRRHDGLYAGGLLFPRNAKKCREAIRAGVIYYCSQAFYPKGITNAWLGNAWGGHLQISPVIARLFSRQTLFDGKKCGQNMDGQSKRYFLRTSE